MKHYDDIAAEDYYEMALEWIAAKNDEKAVSCLRKCVELNPNFIYAFVTLSEVLAGRGDLGEAVHVLKRASKLDPDFVRLHYLQAKYSFRQGNYPVALRAIERAIDISPERLFIRSRRVIRKAMDAEFRRKEKD